jgi:hypothetical protein
MVAKMFVGACGVFMAGFGILTIAKPSATARFVTSFASSRKTHVIEMLFRVSFGAALIRLAGNMSQPPLFWALGWAIVVSSVVLLALPWRVHRRFAAGVLPFIVRRLRLYGAGALAFGMFVLYGVCASNA